MKDLTNLKTFIIDTRDPCEIDDAISLEFDENGKYYIWIHISYPVRLFEFDSDFEEKARKKCCSLYLVNEYIGMIDKDITEIANLKQNKISETLSTRIELAENGSIKDYEIMEAKIKPNYQITYEEANDLIDLEPKEELELILMKDMLMKSYKFRESKGAIIFDIPYSKLYLDENGNPKVSKIDTTTAHKVVSEAMILMGYVYSDFLLKNGLPAPFRSQKINCNASEILERNFTSPVKYSILKQYIGKSNISIKASSHETLGLKSYVQATSPLRRYLDLVIQRQISLKLNNKKTISEDEIKEIIENNKIRQINANNIVKENKLKYLRIFFNNKNESNKLILIRWINSKKNIALVYFPEYYLETLVILYSSIETYPNKIYKVKYYRNDSSNLLEFIN